ncbi:hypothetical protein AB0M34_18470 [Nocardia sp. NPDC050193]
MADRFEGGELRAQQALVATDTHHGGGRLGGCAATTAPASSVQPNSPYSPMFSAASVSFAGGVISAGSCQGVDPATRASDTATSAAPAPSSTRRRRADSARRTAAANATAPAANTTRRRLAPRGPATTEAALPRERGLGDCAGYRYWPVFDSVSIARLALAFLPVTSVRM